MKTMKIKKQVILMNLILKNKNNKNKDKIYILTFIY
jgi:hypothetical protein